MRSYGSKKPSRASQEAAAMGLLLNARVLPSVDTLVRSYGLRPAQAEKMLADARVRREAML